MRVRLTNKTSAAIVVEDLGITLQRSGGADSSCIISQRQYADSKDVKAHSAWIRVDPIPDVEPSKPVRSLPTPVQSPVKKFDPTARGFDALNETLRTTNDRLAQIADILSKMQLNTPAPQIVHVHSQQEQGFVPYSGPSVPAQTSAPSQVFVPSAIVPKDAETRIHVNESTTDSSNFDDAQAALKKLRKK